MLPLIFVTVGNSYRGFARLVGWMDDIASRLEEDVVIQAADTPVQVRHAAAFTFAPPQEIEQRMRQARWVVCHAGVGTLYTARRAGAAIVVVPRRKALGEAVDDHQEEIARALEQQGVVRIAEDAASLEAIVRSTPSAAAWSEPPLVAFLKRRVEHLATELDDAVKREP